MISFFTNFINTQKVKLAIKGLEERMVQDAPVLVGVPKGAGTYEDGLTIATVAAVNNFGSADGVIPPRPFLAPAIDKGSPQYRRLAELLLPKVIAGEMDMRILLEQMGNLAEGHVKQEITDLRIPKNADSTIARKGSDNPLVDDGHLRQSIKYVIADAGDPIEEGI